MNNAAEKLTGTLEQEASKLRALKEEKDLAAKALKKAEDQFKEQERAVLDLMEEQGIESTRIKGVATLTVTKQDIYNADDWGAVYQFIEENSMPHILQRRLSATAIKELSQQGINVPGTSIFQKRGLSLRKA